MFTPSNEIKCREQFGHLLNCHQLLGDAIEIGSLRGDFTIDILSTWHGRCLHVVDPWIEYPEFIETKIGNLSEAYKVFTERTSVFSDRIKIHRAMSSDAVNDFADGSVDFVYIDGNHSYKFVRSDLGLYWPKLRPGGIFAGHDYESIGPWVHDVRKAVDEFAIEHDLEGFYCGGDAYSWYIHKPKEYDCDDSWYYQLKG